MVSARSASACVAKPTPGSPARAARPAFRAILFDGGHRQPDREKILVECVRAVLLGLISTPGLWAVECAVKWTGSGSRDSRWLSSASTIRSWAYWWPLSDGTLFEGFEQIVPPPPLRPILHRADIEEGKALLERMLRGEHAEGLLQPGHLLDPVSRPEPLVQLSNVPPTRTSFI